MQILIGMLLIFAGYIIGSIPFGLLIVKSKTGKDIRQVESGRTGSTNAVRAAGFLAGLMTAVLDILKGVSAFWLAEVFLPANDWIHVLAPIGAIIGHNYFIFLITREEGKIHFHGGAGGAPALGGLTPREHEVVAGVAAGESNREVVQRLKLTEATVKHHISNVFDKLGVSNRAGLAAYATSHGLTQPPPPSTEGEPSR